MGRSSGPDAKGPPRDGNGKAQGPIGLAPAARGDGSVPIGKTRTMMLRSLRSRIMLCASLAGIAGLLAIARGGATAAPDRKGGPPTSWIWLKGTPGDDQAAFFRKEFRLPEGAKSAKLVVAADNKADLLIDGKPVASSGDWSAPVVKDVTSALLGPRARAGGRHLLAASCHNEGGPAGLLVRLTIEVESGTPTVIASDASWKASGSKAEGWEKPAFDDASWGAAAVVARLGDGPWTSVNEASWAPSPIAPSRRPRPRRSSRWPRGSRSSCSTPCPRTSKGSWVNMTVDPKGRLIVSDQYGKLYRVTPPALGGDAAADQGRADRRPDRRGPGPALGVRQPVRRGQSRPASTRAASIGSATPTATTRSTRSRCSAPSRAAASTARTRSSCRPTASRSTWSPATPRP